LSTAGFELKDVLTMGRHKWEKLLTSMDWQKLSYFNDLSHQDALQYDFIAQSAIRNDDNQTNVDVEPNAKRQKID
jgi:hypothetical protein